jgi:hypothetical protein
VLPDKIGTVLVRDYQGRRHTVTVAPDGYVWEGPLCLCGHFGKW